MNLSGREKATIFLSILGSDTASRILRYLPEELADVIATSINHLPTPTPDALGAVLSEFKSALALRPAEPTPVLSSPQVSRSDVPVDIINSASAKKLIYLFSFERPQLIAFILSRLGEEKQDEVLLGLGPQKEIVSDMLRSLKKNKFTNQVEEKLLEIFSKKV